MDTIEILKHIGILITTLGMLWHGLLTLALGVKSFFKLAEVGRAYNHYLLFCLFSLAFLLLWVNGASIDWK